MAYQLETANRHANEILVALRPYCLWSETAGSVRRKKPDPKDIELVSVPNPQHLSELKTLVNSRWGNPKIGAFPSKYTQIRSLLNLDLFWATKETCGLVFFIRTGPRGFVTRALAHWKKITNGGFSDEAVLWKPDGSGGFVKQPTASEEEVFAALKCPFVPPEHRYESIQEQRLYHQRSRNKSRQDAASHPASQWPEG